MAAKRPEDLLCVILMAAKRPEDLLWVVVEQEQVLRSLRSHQDD